MEAVTILVLEDDPTMRATVSEALEDEGYTVVAVGRGIEAVEAARKQPFDLVVTDIRMEGMDGLEALERVKMQQPEVRSLVVTGYASEEDTLRAFRLSAAGYLKKPFELQQLLDMVASLVSQRKAEQQQEKHEAKVRQTSLRALDALARVADLTTAPPGTLRQAGQLVAGLAAQAGFATHVCGEIRLGTILAGGREALGDESLAFLLESPPPYPVIQTILRFVGEKWEGGGPEGLVGDQIPLAARLAAVALGRPGADPQWLARSQSAIEDAVVDSTPASLLMVARALREAGLLEDSRTAYQEILADPRPRAEAVEAWLGLARLGLTQGKAAEVEQAVGKAVAIARELGPVAAAMTGVEGGLLLARALLPQAAETLTSAGRAVHELGLPAATAQAQVAVARLTGRGMENLPAATEVLLAPSHAGELAEVSAWLVPLSLEQLARQPDPRYARLVTKLVGDHLGQVGACLEAGELSPAAKQTLAEVCQGVKGIPEALRHRLQADADPAVSQRAAALGGEAAAEATPWLRIFFMGTFEVFRGEERIADNLWRTQKTKHLLAFLALRKKIPEDVVLESFWPGDVVRGKRNLAVALSFMRATLKPEGPHSSDLSIYRANGILCMESRQSWHDVEEFQSAYGQARAMDGAGDVERAVAAYRRVVQLYRGPFMDGCYMDWALLERTRIEQMAVDAMTRLAQLFQLQAKPRESAEFAEKALELNPESQDLHLLVMRAHIALGRPEQAVKQYEICRKILERDLGIEPSLGLVEAYHRARLGLP